MLDENTNKVVWVGVAVGVVAVIGVAALALFPDVFNNMKKTITDKMSSFSAEGDHNPAAASSGK